jgi:hypothetical protein
VAEDVAKAGLLLEHRAGQRDGEARAPCLAYDHDLEAPAVGADRAREDIAARRDVAAAAVVVALVGEVMAQPPGVRRAVGLRARRLLGRALLRGPDDEPERAHVAHRLEAEDAAHALEGERGVLAPLAVDLQALVRAEAGQVGVQTRLQVCDVGPQPPHFIELPHVRIRASRAKSGRRTARCLEVLHRSGTPVGPLAAFD